jgi:lipopolysaccharide/colanic/teichoic acid biosynthesis glycosyltransferase
MMETLQIDVMPTLIAEQDHIKTNNSEQSTNLHASQFPYISMKVRVLKRCFDVVFSLAILIVGFPVFILIYLVTKLTSQGPAFYKQERLGRYGKPFNIYKFRSMYLDAEKFGPQLAKQDDPRVTRWGRIIRQTKMDELPQFWNVLKGDMSVVGPRPERNHFAEKIINKEPSYKKLLCIRPGITSIGQVEFGYAENVDEMCHRLKYDLRYLKKIGLNSDLQIIYQTIKVMTQKKSKYRM